MEEVKGVAEPVGEVEAVEEAEAVERAKEEVTERVRMQDGGFLQKIGNPYLNMKRTQFVTNAHSMLPNASSVPLLPSLLPKTSNRLNNLRKRQLGSLKHLRLVTKCHAGTVT